MVKQALEVDGGTLLFIRKIQHILMNRDKNSRITQTIKEFRHHVTAFNIFRAAPKKQTCSK